MRVRCCAVLLLAGLPLAAQDPGSLANEAALGKQMASNFRQHAIDDPTIEAWVRRLGEKIAAQIPDARFPFTFTVVADDSCGATHEPAALPGGYVFIPAALFTETRDEAEFAGMLAHAMEHVAQAYAQNAKGGIPLIFVGGWGQACPDLIPALRDYELQADAPAIAVTARAGFDPAALARYIGRSTLPDRARRVAAMQSAIERLPPSDYVETSAEFETIQSEVRRLTERPQPVRDPPTLVRQQ